AGLGVPSPDLPNRDPLAEIEAGTSALAAVDPDGVFEPTLPRAPVPLWRPTEPDADGAPVAAIVRDLGAFFSRADVARLDARLLALAAADREPVAAYRARCRAQPVDLGGNLRELRLACGDGVTDVGRMLSLTGHVTLADGAPTGGLVRSLAVGGHAPVHRLTVTGGALTRHGRAATLELRLGEAALGLSARLATGERLTPMAVRLGDDGAAAVEIGTVDDLGPLRDAIGRLVEAATTAGGGAAALGSGPLRRRAVLAELDAALAAN
ncbi:MAG TPA: hypothetical protein VFG47_07580, partial [Geminicoccaceae bacterium]|nr:hypothetical protein [Geminicoccaceae bacterium]